MSPVVDPSDPQATARAISADEARDIVGKCPACGGSGLFRGAGGYVTCSQYDCPAPDAASTQLEQSAPRALVRLSQWIDAGNAHRDPEAITWGRLAKIAEEHGEVIEAFIGATGQNPRKGTTHTMDQVEKELLDVAITALGAIEHLRGHDGTAVRALNTAIVTVADRAFGSGAPSRPGGVFTPEDADAIRGFQDSAGIVREGGAR